MKRIIEKYLGWLKDSNRPKHMKCGTLVYTVMLLLCFMLYISLVPSAVIAFVATCIVAMSVDYKDKLWGGKFDWLDVVATILSPGIITFIVVLIALL